MNYVSIPFGTIKIVGSNINELNKHEFQFHLVRLRCRRVRAKQSPFPGFNSIWYD